MRLQDKDKKVGPTQSKDLGRDVDMVGNPETGGIVVVDMVHHFFQCWHPHRCHVCLYHHGCCCLCFCWVTYLDCSYDDLVEELGPSFMIKNPEEQDSQVARSLIVVSSSFNQEHVVAKLGKSSFCYIIVTKPTYALGKPTSKQSTRR